MGLSENLLCVFSARIEERDGAYVLEVPRREVAVGGVDVGEVYRIAMLPPAAEASTAKSEPAFERERDGSEPPVDEGDVLDVEIEDIGDQGDGIARIGPGYVVIVPDTEMSERVSVEITEVRENMAFAEVVDRHDRIA